MIENKIIYSNKRIKRVDEGISILEIWLNDLAKEGILSLGSRDGLFFKHIVNTLVAYNLNKIASRISKIPKLISEDIDWVTKVADMIGEIYLLIQAYKNIENLSQELQVEVRTKIGWGQNTDTLKDEPVIKDKWFVIGQKKLKRFDNKSFIYTYLLGEETNNMTLVIRHLDKSNNFDKYLMPGYKFDADLQYYPRSYKLNADYKLRDNIEVFECLEKTIYPDLKSAFNSYSEQVSLNPWLTYFPMLVDDVYFINKEKLLLVDKNSSCVPISKEFKYFEELVSMNMSNGVKVFGEWFNNEFLPLTVFTPYYFISFYNSENLLK